MPWHIHLSGNSAAMLCIHPGSSVNTKNTPEMNCSTSATGVTTAGALRPVRASDENAMPHSVHAVMPSRPTQANVSHLRRCLGSETPKNGTATRQQHDRLGDRDRQHHADLADEVDRRGIGVPRNRLSTPRSRSIGIWMASAWKPVVIRPEAIMPVTKYWVNLTPPPRSPLKIDPKITIMMTGKAIVNMTCSRLRRNCTSLYALPDT